MKIPRGSAPRSFSTRRPAGGSTTPVAFRLRIQMDRRQVDKWVSKTPEQINQALWDAAPEIGDLYVQSLRPYPPPRAGSKYIRTYQLRDGWWWERRHGAKGEVQINVTNKAPYTKWVKDSRYQAWMHVGRWKTIQATNDELLHKTQAVWQRHLRQKVGK